jgi:hypothetical protein
MVDVWEATTAIGTVAIAMGAFYIGSRANRATSSMESIERGRRHGELTPRLRVTCVGVNGGTDELAMRVYLAGPPALDELHRLTVTIRDDHFRRGDHEPLAGGPTVEQIKRHIWGPYQLRPGVGPDRARADKTGRSCVYDEALPLGEELPFPLEPTRPGSWMTATTPEMWRAERGTVIRAVFLCEHDTHGRWRLPVEIDVADLIAGTTDKIILWTLAE